MVLIPTAEGGPTCSPFGMLLFRLKIQKMYLGKQGAVPKKGLRKRAKAEVDRRGGSQSEKALQEQCETVLDYAHIAYIRIPDSINRFIFGTNAVSPHIKRLISSFTKGVPDINILSKDGKFYCVELKTVKGKLSQGQKTFAKKVGEENFYIIRSVEALQELIVDKNIT
ncbi:MAG: hypothetical protein U9N61_01700 [Euryarchaeota archaeon]|nr:hypothetical protein [Euryarchaeota archaeon]